jgi:hypothetical protein
MPGRATFVAVWPRAALVARCVLLLRRRRCLAALAITSFVAATATTPLKASAAFVPVVGGALGIPLGVPFGSLTVGPAFRALAMRALGRCCTFGGLEQVGRSLGSRRLSARRVDVWCFCA